MGASKIRGKVLFPTPPKGAEASFSTSEVDTGRKWIDGKTLWQKTLNMGSTLNANSVAVAHGITGLERIVELGGFGTAAGGVNHVPVPSASNTANNRLEVFADATNVTISSPGNWTTAPHTFYVTLLYTKS